MSALYQLDDLALYVGGLPMLSMFLFGVGGGQSGIQNAPVARDLTHVYDRTLIAPKKRDHLNSNNNNNNSGFLYSAHIRHQ